MLLNLVSGFDPVTLAEADQGPFVFALPCTLRYMFNDEMFSWNVNSAVEADVAGTATMEEIFYGTRNVGLGPDVDGGRQLQQETAPFVTFCQPGAFDDGHLECTIPFDVECKSLFDIQSIFQDFPEANVQAQWVNDAGDAYLPAQQNPPASNRRDTAAAGNDRDAGKEITVMSVGMMDSLQSTSQMGNHARSARTKFDVLLLNADYGSTCIARVAHTHVQQLAR